MPPTSAAQRPKRPEARSGLIATCDVFGLSFETRAEGDERVRAMTARHVHYGSIDKYGTIMAPGLFRDSIPRFLSHGFLAGLNHDWDQPTGVPVRAWDENGGLMVTSEFVNTPAAERDYTLLTQRVSTDRPVVRLTSFTFRPLVSKVISDPDEVRSLWGAWGYAPIPSDENNLARLIGRWGIEVYEKGEIFEVSPVVRAGNDLAEVTEMRSDPEQGIAARQDAAINLHRRFLAQRARELGAL